MLPDTEAQSVTRRRAILTDRERELLRDENAGDQRYVVISRVRTKIQEELGEDADILQQHHSDLYDELREVICTRPQPSGGGREDRAEGDPAPSPDERSGQSEAAQSDPDSLVGEEADPPTPTPTQTGTEIARGDLRNVGFPETRDPKECLAAVQAVCDYLEERESATMREIVRDVMPETPLGYAIPELEEGKCYRGGWWRSVVKPALEELEFIEKPPTGGSEWKFTGEKE